MRIKYNLIKLRRFYCQFNTMSMKNTLLTIGCGLFLLAACNPKSAADTTLSGLKKSDFDTVVSGQQITLYQLKNKNGVEVALTNYGGRIVSIWVPDRQGHFGDIVLGHKSIADYIADKGGNFGALIGRYGNRINQGQFTLKGNTYQLPQNNYGHCLHGGDTGFHHRIWEATQPNAQTLILSCTSPDGEYGFPGTLKTQVTYNLSDDNALKITYEAETDKPTIINLTNHAYFNLSADPSTPILSQQLMLNADHYTPIDSTFMTTGEIAPVAGTPMDFRKLKAIGKEIDRTEFIQLKNGHGYDHNYVLNTRGEISQVAAKAYDPGSGRFLEVYTNEPGIQFYAGNFLDGTVKGKKDIYYPFRSAFCLETQHYPDSPNKTEWPSVTLQPGEKYNSICIYKFGSE